MKLQSMKGALAALATAATLFITGVIANADSYTVKAGDTLSKIANEKSTTVESLVRINKIQNPDLIFVDQVLELDETKAGQTGVEIASAPVTTEQPSQAVPIAEVSTGSTDYSAYNSGVILSNGNTAGEVGSYAASRIAELTGVPTSTWEVIIAC